jgi:hypothetical protein
MEHTNTLCGQNIEFWCVKAGGIYSNHSALKGAFSWQIKPKVTLFDFNDCKVKIILFLLLNYVIKFCAMKAYGEVDV